MESKSSDSIVDSYCHLTNVVVLNDDDIIYGCTLTYTDISNNSNKFYIIQLLCQTDTKQFYLYTRYGRVGEKGVVGNAQAFEDMDLAIKKFKVLFKNKTGNVWDDASSFDPLPGKYYRLKLSHIDVEISNEKDEIKSEEVSIEKLDKRVDEFIAFISNNKLHVSTIQNFNINTDKMPLGKISDSLIKECHSILKNINEIVLSINDGTWEKSKLLLNVTDDNLVYDLLVSYSNKFWTRIPYACSRNQKPPIINTKEQVETYAELLEVMQNSKIAGKITKLSTNVFSIYEKMHVDINVCENTDERKIISNFIYGTHAATHYYKTEILEIFSVSRNDELHGKDAKNIFEKTCDHRILCHGTRSSNIMGILTEGLRVPNSNQIANGAILGRGIYFANASTKSFNYCDCSSSNNNIGYLFLCEVALGDVRANKLQNESKVEKFDTMISYGQETISKDISSRWGLGKTTIGETGYCNFYTYDLQNMKCDVRIPQGPLVNRNPRELSSYSSFQYDEFVIGDPRLYRFRYVVKIQMK